MSVPSEEEYLKKYSSGTLLTTSGSEPHTDLSHILSEDSVHGVSRIPREIQIDAEENITSSLYCVDMEERRHTKLHS